MTFGQEVMGVPDGLLHLQRRKAAAAALPGVAGGTVDEVLFAADLNVGRARADPAFGAHEGPIGAWAEAVWRQLMDRGTLQILFAKARVKLCGKSRTWAAVNGPASAMLATASRLGWEAQDAYRMCDDLGRGISLLEDSPAAVKTYVRESVGRWRMRRLGRTVGARCGADGSLEVQGLEEALRVRKYAWWSGREAACLRSTIGGRQWPQNRLHTAGLATEAGCQLCKKACEKTVQAAVGVAGATYGRVGLKSATSGIRTNAKSLIESGVSLFNLLWMSV